ncbi:MAG: hypothetical protein LBS16_06665 [Prevotellaceae bacterium]|nr:hypothetical protein [Prevotellaceae bacterium]
MKNECRQALPPRTSFAIISVLVLPLASPIFNSGRGWCVVLVPQVADLRL